jgi:hypothetical protein
MRKYAESTATTNTTQSCKIGLTSAQVMAASCAPDHVNSTVTSSATREQWFMEVVIICILKVTICGGCSSKERHKFSCAVLSLPLDRTRLPAVYESTRQRHRARHPHRRSSRGPQRYALSARNFTKRASCSAISFRSASAVGDIPIEVVVFALPKARGEVG